VKCYRCSSWPCECRDGITVIHGDSREVLPHLPAVSVMLTDPPYGIDGGRGGDRRLGKGDYLASEWEDTPKYIEQTVIPIVEFLVMSGVRAAVTPGLRCWRLYPKEDGCGCFWLPAAVTHGPWGFTCFTPILYYGRDPRSGIGQLPSGISVTEASEKNGHPCPKPLSAWKWLLNKLGPAECEITIDPFAGSGTTLVAAKQIGRKAIGVEIEERYVEIICNRLRQEVLAFTD
jgi:DNA modification methylase